MSKSVKKNIYELKTITKKLLANGNQRWRSGAWTKTYNFQCCVIYF